MVAPIPVGKRRFSSVAITVLAAIGASLLAVVAAMEWRHFNDEHAYWLAAVRLATGAPLYDPTALPNTPFAYWYPPPLAQVLAPFTSVVSADVFSLAWTALLLACLWWLGGRNLFVALALVAFLPVAAELRVRNVHLVMAVLVVLALRRSWAFWVPAAALKITPVLGIAYLAAAGRVRDAVKVSILGAAVLAVSFLLSPDAWRAFLEIVGARAGTDGGSWFEVPFAVRFGAGLLLTIGAGVLARRAAREGRRERVGEVLLVVALTIANPTLWATAFSILIAIVPLWWTGTVPRAVPQPSPELVSGSQSAVQGNVIAG